MPRLTPTIDVENVSSLESSESYPLNSESSSIHLTPNKTEAGFSRSFESFVILRDANFFRNNEYGNKKGFLKGPKKFCRLFALGLCLPVLLLSIPLYVRLILYPPTHVPMAPTDQRLLSGKVSSVWCRGQTVQMNGSFSAFLMNEKPHIKKDFSVHSMNRHIVLKDDFKEYWGFFLQKGSVVNIDMCIRHDGGSLMIIRGSDNLKKCAWIGEEDSAEQDEDHDEESNESGEIPEGSRYIPDGLYLQTPDLKLANPQNTLKPNAIKPKITPTSEERRRDLDFFMRRVIQLSRNSKEILNSLIKHRRPSHVKPVEDQSKSEAIAAKKRRKRKKLKAKDRIKRSLTEDETNVAAEESVEVVAKHNKKSLFLQAYNATEDELYKRIFQVPKGLNIERGTFFHRNNENDTSNEEHRSSFSSSEEALLNCEGLLGAIPLYADRACNSPNSPSSNNVTYKIPATGTYYFVFSSDNEIFDSDLFFNMTLKRVIYDTDYSKESCLNKSSCSLAFSFWSHDQAIVEVPEGDWDSAFIVQSKCDPRVSIYMLILMLIPIFILLGAFH